MNTSRWEVNAIPDLSGKTIIITGSSSGLGLETARVLAGKNASVVIAVRNLFKGNSAADLIREEYSDAELTVMGLDLASLESIRGFAHNFRQNYKKLDLLINNAGVMMSPFARTSDGFELQFGTNHLGHFALTGLLLDPILCCPGSRIVTLSSIAHKNGKLNLDDVSWKTRKYNTHQAYFDSKIANLHFTFELDRRLKAAQAETIALAAHPGSTKTELQRHSALVSFLNNIIAQDVIMGALPTLRAAFDESVTGGEFFGPEKFMETRGYPVQVQPSKLSQDKETAAKLWRLSEEMTGIRYPI